MSINENKFPSFDSFSTENHFQLIPDLPVLKRETDKDIYLYLLKDGNIGKTREQICTDLNLPRSSVYDSLTRLNISQLIEIDYKKPKTRRGRPSTLYFLKNFSQGRNR